MGLENADGENSFYSGRSKTVELTALHSLQFFSESDTLYKLLLKS